ncbi:11710_t:CDS:2, partial [Racocetra persica]
TLNGYNYKKSNIISGFEEKAIGCSTSDSPIFGTTNLNIQSGSKSSESGNQLGAQKSSILWGAGSHKKEHHDKKEYKKAWTIFSEIDTSKCFFYEKKDNEGRKLLLELNKSNTEYKYGAKYLIAINSLKDSNPGFKKDEKLDYKNYKEINDNSLNAKDYFISKPNLCIEFSCD